MEQLRDIGYADQTKVTSPGRWAGDVSHSVLEGAKQTVENPYFVPALIAAGTLAVGLVGQGKAFNIGRLFPESKMLLSDIERQAASEIDGVLVQRDFAMLIGRGDTLVPTNSFRPTPLEELTQRYSTMQDRNINFYIRGGKSYNRSEARLPQLSDSYPNTHLNVLSGLLKDRYGEKSGLRMLELAPDATTDVPRTLEPNLLSYTAIDAQRVPLEDQRGFLENTNIPQIFHAQQIWPDFHSPANRTI